MSEIISPVRAFQIGDEVVLLPEYATPSLPSTQVWVVNKVPTGSKGVNYVMHPKGRPEARGLRARGSMLALASQAPKPPVGAPLVTLPPVNVLPPVGAIVRGSDRRMVGKLFVVTSQNYAKGTVRLDDLGGSPDGKYWPSVPVDILTVLDPEKMYEALAAV